MSVTLHNELPSGYFLSLGMVTPNGANLLSTPGELRRLPLPSVHAVNLFAGKTGTVGTPIGSLIVHSEGPPAFHVGTMNSSGVCYDVKVHASGPASIYVGVSLCPGTQPSPAPVPHGAVPVHILPNAVIPVSPSPTPTHVDTHSVPVLTTRCHNGNASACDQLCGVLGRQMGCQNLNDYSGAWSCNIGNEILECCSDSRCPRPGQWVPGPTWGQEEKKSGMSFGSAPSRHCDVRCGVQPPLSGRVFPVRDGQGVNCGTSDGSLCGHMTGYTWQIPTTMMSLNEDLL